ncbi:hypothetical protein BDA99DRAFT_502555 [Phascolomyces articulosus]|uniref:Uncharacterized protein n=1 Tax=Phascolomyces articulosus TaxID=60185 RepID=A0AAD5K5X3_9FUNG|nr:hypothetical protein BDA99DRAFT_502555 [Phascolomyces articulosus]
MRFSIISVAAAVCIVAGVQAAPAGPPAAGPPATGPAGALNLVGGGADATSAIAPATSVVGSATKLGGTGAGTGPNIVPGVVKRAEKQGPAKDETPANGATAAETTSNNGLTKDPSTQPEGTPEQGNGGVTGKLTDTVKKIGGTSSGNGISTTKLTTPTTGAVDGAAQKLTGGQGNAGLVPGAVQKVAV